MAAESIEQMMPTVARRVSPDARPVMLAPIEPKKAAQASQNFLLVSFSFIVSPYAIGVPSA